MIPLYPDWSAIATELRLRYGSDDKVSLELSKQGVSVDRCILASLRLGERKQPKEFENCAALLNLLAVPKAHVGLCSKATSVRVRENCRRIAKARRRDGSRFGAFGL